MGSRFADKPADYGVYRSVTLLYSKKKKRKINNGEHVYRNTFCVFFQGKSHSILRPSHVPSVCCLQYNVLILQVTNAGVRRPGNEARTLSTLMTSLLLCSLRVWMSLLLMPTEESNASSPPRSRSSSPSVHTSAKHKESISTQLWSLLHAS